MPTAFVIMPFSDEFDEIYEQFISNALQEVGYEVRRANDVVSHQNILRDIVQGIARSDLVVADVTGSNPNVYYELGLAHALRKPVIVLTQEISELPFDLRSYRVISYTTHFSQISRARRQLVSLANEAQSGQVPFGSPITDFLSISEYTDSSLSTEVAPLGDDEPGIIDHLIQMEEWFSTITNIMQNITEETGIITQQTDTFGSRLEDLSDPTNPESIRQAHRLILAYADRLSGYSRFLSERNGEYRDILGSAGTSLEYVVGFQTVDAEDSRQRLTDFIEVLINVEESARGSRDAFSVTSETIRSIPNMERTFNRARNSVIRQIDQLVDNIDQTISIIARTREIGETLLENSEGVT